VALRAILCVCCEIAVQDSRTATISLFNLVDELTALSFPVVIPKLTIVAILAREAEDPDRPETRVRGTLNGNVLFDLIMGIEFQGKLRSRAIGEFQGLVLGAPGTLKITITLGTDELASWDIAVLAAGVPAVDLFSGPSAPPQPN
jgi:hypothetical protein